MAQTTVSLPKAQGGFAVVNFRLKAEAFALQWLKRFFVSSKGRWKTFFVYFSTSTFNFEPCNTLLTVQPRRLLRSLPTFYQLLSRVWRALDGGLIVGSDELGIRVSSGNPINISQLIWVARCDFRFRQEVPIASQILHIVVIRIKFNLSLLFKRCKSLAQIRTFEWKWLGRGSLGYLEGSELVFSFEASLFSLFSF